MFVETDEQSHIYSTKVKSVPVQAKESQNSVAAAAAKPRGFWLHREASPGGLWTKPWRTRSNQEE